MKQNFLKISGLNEEQFYKRFPTENHFFKQYPHLKKRGYLKKLDNGGGITHTDTQSPLLPKNKDYLSLSYGNSPNNTLNNNFNLDFGKKLGAASTTDNDTSFLGRTMLEGNLSKNTNYDIGADLKIPFSGNTYSKVGVNNLLSGAKPFAELNAEKGWNFGGGRYNQNPIGRFNTHGNLSMTTGQDPTLKVGTGVNLNLGNNFGVNGNIDYSINKDISGKGIALPNSNNVQGNVGLTYNPNLSSNKSSQEEQIRLAKIKNERIRNSRPNTYTPPHYKKGGYLPRLGGGGNPLNVTQGIDSTKKLDFSNLTNPLALESTATSALSSVFNRNLANKNYDFSNDQQAGQYYTDQKTMAGRNFGAQALTGVGASLIDPAMIPFEAVKLATAGYDWYKSGKEESSGISGIKQNRNVNGYTNYNDPTTGLPMAKDGMQIPNGAKIEKNEVIYDKGTESQVLNKPTDQTSSVTQTVHAGTHESGNDATVSGGSDAYVFSDTLKNPLTKNTFADDANILGQIRGLFESKISKISSNMESSKKRTLGDGKDMFSKGTQKMYSNRIKNIQETNIKPIDGELDKLTELNEQERVSKENSEQEYKYGGNLNEYPDGGKFPTIYTNNPNDPRLRAYNDSNNLYNFNNVIESTNKYVNKMKHKFETNSLTNPETNSNSTNYFKALDRHQELYDRVQRVMRNTGIKPSIINPNYNAYEGGIRIKFKQPSQPIIYKKESDKLVPYTGKIESSGKFSTNADKDYNIWKNKLPENLQYEGDYDLKGFYKENPTWTPDNKDVHMTDKFKLPNHPTFSNESMYYKEGMKAGYWVGDKYNPLKEGEKVPVTPQSRPVYNPNYDQDKRANLLAERQAQTAAYGEAKKTNPNLTLMEFQRTYKTTPKVDLSKPYGNQILRKGGYMKYEGGGNIRPTHVLSDNDPYEYSNTNGKWYTSKKGENNWIDISNNQAAVNNLKSAKPYTFYPPTTTDFNADNTIIDESPSNTSGTIRPSVPNMRFPDNATKPTYTPLSYTPDLIANVNNRGFKYDNTDVLGGLSILSNTIGTLAQRRPANMGMMQAPKYTIPNDNLIQNAQYDINKSFNTGVKTLRNESPNSAVTMANLQGLYGKNVDALSQLRNQLSERQQTARDNNYNANIETMNKNTGINYENQNNQRGFDNTKLTQLNQGVQKGLEYANQKDLVKAHGSNQMDQLKLVLSNLSPAVRASVEKELATLESYNAINGTQPKRKNGGYISKYKRK